MIVNKGAAIKWMGISAYVLLLLFTLFINNKAFYYDEPFFTYNLHLIDKLGAGKEFYLKMIGLAGPLHSYIHWLLLPIIKFNVALYRLVNILFLGGFLFVVRGIARKIGMCDNAGSREALVFAVFSIPMAYVCAGLALTEMPALFFVSLAYYCLLSVRKTGLQLVLAATFFSLAILGRQPYLLLVLPFVYYLYRGIKERGQRAVAIALFLLISLSYPVYVFSVWKALVPLYYGRAAIAGKAFSFSSFLLGLGYSALVLFFINYNFFRLLRKKEMLVYALLFAVVTLLCFLGKFGFPVMTTLTHKIIPPSLWGFTENVTAALLVIFGFYFLHMMALHAWAKRDNLEYQLLYISAFIMILSVAKITHQFSSRYIFQSALFLVLLGYTPRLTGRHLALRMLGMALGFSSLLSYYFFYTK